MSFLCKYCESVWLHVDPSIRYPSSGKCIPLMENGERHDFRDCPMSSYNLNRRSTIRARTVRKSAIKRVDDFQLIEDAKAYIYQINLRLSQYKLSLVVNKKEQSLLEEML